MHEIIMNHVYELDSYWVVASSAEEAFEIFEDDWGTDTDIENMRLCRDDETMEISVDKTGAICPMDDAHDMLKLTMREWANREGVGQLCTEHY